MKVNSMSLLVIKKIVVFQILSFLFLVNTQQPLKNARKLIIEYKYNTIFMNGDKGEYQLYFIVDSSKYRYHAKKRFYQFTFSTDSTDITGYVNYNSGKKKLEFIAKNLGAKISHSRYTTIQSIFEFNNSKPILVRSLDILGEKARLSLKGLNKKSHYNFKIDVVTLSPMPSENSLIKCMYFSDQFYPDLLIVRDPILGKDMKVKANIFK